MIESDVRRIIREEMRGMTANAVQPVRRPFGGYDERNQGAYEAYNAQFQDHTDIYDATFRAKHPGAASYNRVLYAEAYNILVAFPEEDNPEFEQPYIILGLKAARGYGRDYRFLDRSIDGAGMYYVAEDVAEDVIDAPSDTLMELDSPYAAHLTNTRPTRTLTRESVVREKAKSKSQQRLFGMVHAFKKGELDLDDLPSQLADTVRGIASNISDEKAKEYASTAHDGLPGRVEERTRRRVRRAIRRVLS